MHVRYSFSRLLLGLCLLALAPFQVAQAAFKTAPTANGYAYDWDLSGTYTNHHWYPPGEPSSGNTRYGVSGGLPTATGYSRVPLGNQGVTIDVEARTLPSRASIAGAIGRFGRKVLPGISTAYALAELFDELGYLLNPDGSVSREDPSVCTVGPCYLYTTRSQTSTALMEPYLSTKSAACRRAMDTVEAVNASGAYAWRNPMVLMDDQGSSCNFRDSAGSPVYYNWPYAAQTTVVSEPRYLPSSWPEFETSIANKTDWASDSKLPVIIKEAADAGEPIEAPEPTLVGPTSKAGPSTTTSNPDGTTTTKTTTYNVTYNGDQFTYNTTVITNNNGQITTETADPEPSPDQCERYPDTLGCASLGNPETSSLKSSNHAVTVSPVSFASAAGCPAPLTFNVGPSAYSISYQPACDRLALLRVLFLAIAAVLAAFILADSFRVT